jgi:hypothetical protein
MGNCCSSTADPEPKNEIALQVPIQQSIPPSIPASIPASITPVESSVSEIRRTRSRQGSIKSVKSTRSARRSPQVESSYTRPRVKSAPQKVPTMKVMEDAPPLPHPAGQRSRAKSSTASSSRSPNSDHRQTSAGEHNDGRTCEPSLTMIRTLKGNPQTTDHELSRPAATQFNSPPSAPRKLPVCSSTLYPTSSRHHSYISLRFRILVVGKVRTRCAHTSVSTDRGHHFIMTESLWKIVAHQDRFQGGYDSVFPS